MLQFCGEWQFYLHFLTRQEVGKTDDVLDAGAMPSCSRQTYSHISSLSTKHPCKTTSLTGVQSTETAVSTTPACWQISNKHLLRTLRRLIAEPYLVV